MSPYKFSATAMKGFVVVVVIICQVICGGKVGERKQTRA
jgi:hypothetical protein